MKVLICGEYGVFCKELINRLKKEKHTIFVITGSEKPRFRKPGDGILQDYNFSFRSRSIRTIIKNVHADVMIVLGACDVRYSWKDTGQEAVRYLSGMTNLFVCAKEAGVPQIIYCSSLGVYEDIKEQKITRGSEFRASSPIFQSYVQIENLCQKQSADETTKITKVRFPEIYGEYSTYKPDICAALMEAACTGQEMYVVPGKQHRILYVKDAVDVLVRILALPEKKDSYLIEGTVYAEGQIAKEIKNMIPGWNGDIVSEPEEFMPLPKLEQGEAELSGFYEKYELKDGLKQFYKIYENEKRDSTDKDLRKVLWKEKLLPFFENVGLFLITFVLSYFLKGTWFAEHVNLYLFYLVIIAVTYGCGHALLASLLTFVAKIAEFISVSAPIEYTGFVDVLQILIVGVAVGYMRDKYRRKWADEEDEKKYFQSELVDLTKIYDSNKSIKEMYEKRLMNYENSMSWIYETASRLDFWEPAKVIFQAVDVVCELLDVQDVAIYVAGKNEKSLRLMAASSGKARGMGNSIRIDTTFFMYSEIESGSVFRSKDLDTDVPAYACGIYSESSLIAIIMVWTSDLSKINLYLSNMFALLCRLIEDSMSRAYLFWNELSRQYVAGTNVLNQTGFQTVHELCEQGKKEGKVQYTLLTIPSEAFLLEPIAMYEKIGNMIRETDYVGQTADGLEVILMNASEEETENVLERFRNRSIPVNQIQE